MEYYEYFYECGVCVIKADTQTGRCIRHYQAGDTCETGLSLPFWRSAAAWHAGGVIILPERCHNIIGITKEEFDRFLKTGQKPVGLPLP